jgi:4-alpha-glucanotransferase
MSTIRGWWKEDSALTRKFFNRELSLSGKPPREAQPEVVRAVIRQHLASPAMWSIFQLQDLLGTDEQLRRADADSERINQPANPKHYWRYRMHLTLKELRKANDFNTALRELIRQSGR